MSTKLWWLYRFKKRWPRKRWGSNCY